MKITRREFFKYPVAVALAVAMPALALAAETKPSIKGGFVTIKSLPLREFGNIVPKLLVDAEAGKYKRYHIEGVIVSASIREVTQADGSIRYYADMALAVPPDCLALKVMAERIENSGAIFRNISQYCSQNNKDFHVIAATF